MGHLKKLRHLLPLLEDLHEEGCGRDRAGNRRLHFDQYVILVLLYLFNPLIDSLRVLQEASALDKIARQLGVGRFSLGSFSESVRVFDPRKLKAVIGQLADQLKPLQGDPRLKEHLSHVLTVADGTVLDAIGKVADAFWLKFKDDSPKHAWKLHVQLDVNSFCAIEAQLTDARNSGQSNEKNVPRQTLAADHCYVIDRGFAQFALFNQIHAAGSSYVCRMKENSAFEVLQERLLSDGDLAAGVVRDALVEMGRPIPAAAKPDHPMRLVILEAQEHEKRGGRKGKTAGPPSKGLIVLATNLLEAPAQIIALIYRYRWTIEIFFRFFKQTLGCRHLLSQTSASSVEPRSEGVRIQVYCAIIACMLINLWTGKKPGKHMVNLPAWYFMGVADAKEVQAFLDRPDNTGVKLRKKDELWKKMGW